MGGIGVDAHRFEAVFHPLVIELLGAELLERVVGRRTCQARVPAVEGHERHGAVEDHERRAQRRDGVAPAPRDEVHRMQKRR